MSKIHEMIALTRNQDRKRRVARFFVVLLRAVPISLLIEHYLKFVPVYVRVPICIFLVSFVLLAHAED